MVSTPESPGPGPQAGRGTIVKWCDVALAALLTWQTLDVTKPAATITAGFVFAIRVAASRSHE